MDKEAQMREAIERVIPILEQALASLEKLRADIKRQVDKSNADT